MFDKFFKLFGLPFLLTPNAQFLDGEASVQTIRLGQPRFRPALPSKDWEQLRQRVLTSYQLDPLTESETRGYIELRRGTVRWRADPIWEDAAFTAIHRQADGIPRRINTLCSRVLLLGALEEAHAITGRMVDDTAEKLNRYFGGRLDLASSPATRLNADDRDDLIWRIEQREHRAFRQQHVSTRVMDLLELTATGQL